MRTRVSVLGWLLLIGSFALAQAAPAPRKIAITMDDLPKAVVGQSEFGDISDVRATVWQLSGDLAGVPVIGFVNEQKLYAPGQLDERMDVLRMWLARGHELGNHTFSHLDFQTTPLGRFEDDTIHGEVVTRQLMREQGRDEQFFRFPYNHTGPTKDAKEAFARFLAERGYRVAPFTVQHDDYIFNDVYVRARRSWNSALQERVRAAYLDHLDTALDYYERITRDLFGHDIPQILLIHANDLNADAIGDMLHKLRQRGYTFVSLDEALRDPAYQSKDDYVGPYGISWIQRWARTKGVKIDANEPDPPKWILDLYKQAQK
jgi:peptidoglycan/xylan/chitin deacetylase (PgdA/CDA1 family)